MNVLGLLGLLRAPRIVSATLVSAPVAIAGGRSAVHVVIDGAGVLKVGDVRLSFLRGLDRTLIVPVADALGRAVTLRVRSLVGSDERTLSFVPLPPLAGVAVPSLVEHAPTAVLPHGPAALRVQVPPVSMQTFPRGRPT